MGLTTKEISSSSFNDMISSVDRRSEYVENRAGANVRLNNFLTPYTLDDKSSILNAPCGYSNGVYASLRPVQTFGSELVTNGDFSDGTNNWTPNTNATLSIDNGRLKVSISGSASGYPSQNITTVVGKKYKITADAFIGTATKVSLYSAAFGFNDLTADGSYDLTFTATSTSTQIRLYVYGDGSYGFWDNVSVKEVTDADFDFTRGSAATRVTKDGLIKNVQILSDELVQNGNFEEIGPEEVTNGDFATDSDWVKGTGWSISGGAAVAVAGTSSKLEQQISGLNGKTCKVSLTLSNYGGSGSMYVDFGNVNSSLINTNGEHILYGTFSQNELELFKGGAFSGSIDNVSVKEVGQNWSFGTDWSMGDGKAVRTGTTSSGLTQSGSFNNNKKYKLEFTISDYVSGSIKGEFSGGGGSDVFFTSNNIGNGTFSFITETTTNRTNLQFYAFNSFSGSIDNISLIEITDDTDLPRIDYTNGTGSLLLEPQRTNNLNYSEQFDNAYWVNNGVTINSSQVISPDGNLTADLLTGVSGGFGVVVFSKWSSTNNAASCFAKKGSTNLFKISNASGGVGGVTFNVENGTITNTDSGFTGTIEDFGNGWYRCTAIDTSARSGTLSLGVTAATESIYLWGAQLEEDYATSYIPTEGSTVTRNADLCNNAGSSDLINSTEGVLYAEIASLANDGTDKAISISDGTNNNRIWIGYSTANERIYSLGYSGNNIQFVMYEDLLDETDFVKVAVKYKENDFALWVNGIEASTDNNGLTPVGLNSLNFNISSGSISFYGNVRSVAVFKEALTDEELAKITSTTQQEVFYEMRDRMLQINADYYEFGDYTTRLKKLF